MINKPEQSEYNTYYQKYIEALPQNGILEFLKSKTADFKNLLSGLSEEQLDYAYQSGKWTIRQSIIHVIDTEQIFAYRLLSIIRGEKQSLIGFDQDEYVENADIAHYNKTQLINQFSALRQYHDILFANVSESDWEKTISLMGQNTSARAIIYIITGHLVHHIQLLKDRYLNV